MRTAFGDYCNIPYYLHAILMHDGTAETGHYYSFIYDRKQEVWWRFSDVNVSIELEEVVMREAFGGQVATLKTAYSLIYINEFCKQGIEQRKVAPFLNGKFTNINSELRNKIIIDNNSFNVAYERYIAKRTFDSIRRRFLEKKRAIEESKAQLDQILHIPLLNFVYHLNHENKQVFFEWVMLNQATVDEMGSPEMGLRAITQDKNSNLYKELEKEYKPGFLIMTPKDEQSLDVHKRTFKEDKRKYAILTYALKILNDDLEGWRPILQAIQYIKDRTNPRKKELTSFDSLLQDLIRVYVLDCLT